MPLNSNSTIQEITAAINAIPLVNKDGRLAIKNAIVAKGGTVADADGDGYPTHDELKTAIDNVVSWDPDLIAKNIKQGVNIFGVNGSLKYDTGYQLDPTSMGVPYPIRPVYGYGEWNSSPSASSVVIHELDNSYSVFMYLNGYHYWYHYDVNGALIFSRSNLGATPTHAYKHTTDVFYLQIGSGITMYKNSNATFTTMSAFSLGQNAAHFRYINGKLYVLDYGGSRMVICTIDASFNLVIVKTQVLRINGVAITASSVQVYNVGASIAYDYSTEKLYIKDGGLGGYLYEIPFDENLATPINCKVSAQYYGVGAGVSDTYVFGYVASASIRKFLKSDMSIVATYTTGVGNDDSGRQRMFMADDGIGKYQHYGMSNGGLAPFHCITDYNITDGSVRSRSYFGDQFISGVLSKNKDYALMLYYQYSSTANYWRIYVGKVDLKVKLP